MIQPPRRDSASSASSHYATPSEGSSQSPSLTRSSLPLPTRESLSGASLSEHQVSQQIPVSSSKIKNYFERMPLTSFLKSAGSLVTGKFSQSKLHFNAGREGMTDNVLRPARFVKNKLSPPPQDFTQHTQDLVQRLQAENSQVKKTELDLQESLAELFPKGEFYLDEKSGSIVAKSKDVIYLTDDLQDVQDHSCLGGLFTGNLYRGEPHGEGIILYDNGESYQGNFKEGLREGLGSFTYDTGENFTGLFQNDMILIGAGTIYHEGGEVSEGSFVEGRLIDGKGLLLLDPSGLKYYGEVRDGKPHDDHGKLIHPDGFEEIVKFVYGSRE